MCYRLSTILHIKNKWKQGKYLFQNLDKKKYLRFDKNFLAFMLDDHGPTGLWQDELNCVVQPSQHIKCLRIFEDVYKKFL